MSLDEPYTNSEEIVIYVTGKKFRWYRVNSIRETVAVSGITFVTSAAALEHIERTQSQPYRIVFA